MSTELKNLIPMLICNDVPESVRFYSRALGFAVATRMDDVGKSSWGSLNKVPVQLRPAGPHDAREPVEVNGRYPQGVHCFRPEDVVALHASVLAEGFQTGGFLRHERVRDGRFQQTHPLFGQETDEDASFVEED